MRNKKNTFLGKNFIIRAGSSLGGRHIQCGDNVRIGHGCHLFGNIYMGDDIMIAPNVVIAGGNHGIEKSGVPMINQPSKNKGSIRIGSDVWIAANSVVLCGVEIGEGAVVGAGSVVVKSGPKFSIVAGNPAKIIKYRA